MKRHILLVLAASLLLGADAKQDDKKEAKSDQELIQGTWEVVDWQAGGKDLTKEVNGSIEFTKRKMVIRRGEDALEFTYDLNLETVPRSIDIIFDDEVKKGIYELSADRLKVCLPNDAREERATAFESKPESVNYSLTTLKRVKSKDGNEK